MNDKSSVSSIEIINKKFKNCPICKKEINIKVYSDSFYIDCKCGLHVITDDEANILRYTYNDDNDNTRCMLCGDKVEGGYCGCFNHK